MLIKSAHKLSSWADLTLFEQNGLLEQSPSLYIYCVVIMKSITKVSKGKRGDYIKKIKDKAEKRNPTLAALDKLGSNEPQQIYGYIVTFSSN